MAMAGAVVRRAAAVSGVSRRALGFALVGIVDRALLDRDSAEDEHAPVGALFGAAVPDIALPGETCRNVAARLAVKGLDRVPVVKDEKTYRLIGIVSRHDLLKPSTAVFAEERGRERFLAAWRPRRVSIGE